MSYPGKRQTYIRFSLTMQESGGVLTPAPLRANRADAVIDTDHTGRAHIPGTSLAGALKAAVAAGPPEAAALVSLFGDVDRDSAVASSIWVLGAYLNCDETRAPTAAGRESAEWVKAVDEGFARERGSSGGTEEWTERRQWMSTAINRATGAARNGTLRQTEFLPAGTTFTAYLRWDGAQESEIRALADLLLTWEPALGRATSTGHGKCSVGSLFVGTLDLTKAEHRATWFTKSGPALFDAAVGTEEWRGSKDTSGAESARQILSVQLRTEGPLVIGARGAAERHTGPMRTRRMHAPDGTLALAIPGTAIKGVVRSRMEYILRSLGLPACIERSHGTCLPCQFFGYTDHGAQTTSVGRRAAVRVENSFVSPQPGWTADTMVRVRTHVPLDRFTGGSGRKSPTDAKIHPPSERGGMLHQIEGIEGGEFDLTFDVSKLDREALADFAALLRLVVEDLHDGLTGFGHAVNRGYGSVRVRSSEKAKGSELKIKDLPTGRAARDRMARMLERHQRHLEERAALPEDEREQECKND